MNLKKIGKVLTSKSVGTGPSSCEKRIYRAAVSQSLRNTGLVNLVNEFISTGKMIIHRVIPKYPEKSSSRRQFIHHIPMCTALRLDPVHHGKRPKRNPGV